jgi:Mitochondrial ribosomal protein L51 / S25 / CI-B8 domain
MARLRVRGHTRRDWYFKNYAELKLLNPRLPIVLRNNEDEDPYMIVRYGEARAVTLRGPGMCSVFVFVCLCRRLSLCLL